MADLHLRGLPADERERAAVDAVVAATGPALAVEGPRFVRGGRTRGRERRHLLLPVLHALQHEVGWISPGGLEYACDQLQVPPAEAYGVATFYEMLRTTEPDRIGPTIHVCEDLACRLDRRHEAEVAQLEAAGEIVHRSPCLGQCDRPVGRFVQAVGVPDSQPHGQAAAPQLGASGLRVLARVGVVDPTSLDSYRAAGGFEALARAHALGTDGVIETLEASGLSGRGGAAFPTGTKWRAVRDAPGDRKHVIANADESEPGTFKDRLLLEADPFALIEALCIAGFTVGAAEGWIYVRGEYPLATERLTSALDQCRAAGLLGDGFDIELRSGAGAYICGEETALFASIEGFRGEPRNKPPYPTTHGLFGEPTAINNPETLYNVAPILLEGAAAYRSIGTEASPGTRLFCLSGRVGRPGVYEAPFGVSLGELLELAGGVVGELNAVLLGGAAGAFVGPDRLDLALSLEATRAAGATLGSGVVMAFGVDDDLTDIVERIAEFFRGESCGQCVPCRVGTVRQHETVVELRRTGELSPDRRELLDDLAAVMGDASICGLGHTAASAVRSAIDLGLIGGAHG